MDGCAFSTVAPQKHTARYSPCSALHAFLREMKGGAFQGTFGIFSLLLFVVLPVVADVIKDAFAAY